MATTKQSISPGDDSRRGEPVEPAVSAAVVVVENGEPTPKQVFVSRNGTVQFVNHDSVDYKLRLYARGRQIHADVDLLLSGRCGITVIVDQGLGGPGECYYELFPIVVAFLDCFDEAIAALSAACAQAPPDGSYDQEPLKLAEEAVKVPAPPAPSAPSSPLVPLLSALTKKGPGGGVITVP
jgi:hypothetical protein